jgi:hypothetical protein
MKKNFFLLFFLVLSSKCLYSQLPKNIQGKYCEDLGFGWYCILLNTHGTYKKDGGHSYWAHRTTGKWTIHNDTLTLTPHRVRKIKPRPQLFSRAAEKYIFYYLIQSDTIYSLYLNPETKKFERGSPLIND